MTIDTLLRAVLLVGVWKWRWWLAAPVVILFLVVDGAYFAANLTKVVDGGWCPLLVGAVGWLECAVHDEVSVGTHTLFVCEVERVEHGVDAPALVRVRGGFATA